MAGFDSFALDEMLGIMDYSKGLEHGYVPIFMSLFMIVKNWKTLMIDSFRYFSTVSRLLLLDNLILNFIPYTCNCMCECFWLQMHVGFHYILRFPM